MGESMVGLCDIFIDQKKLDSSGIGTASTHRAQ